MQGENEEAVNLNSTDCFQNNILNLNFEDKEQTCQTPS